MTSDLAEAIANKVRSGKLNLFKSTSVGELLGQISYTYKHPEVYMRTVKEVVSGIFKSKQTPRQKVYLVIRFTKIPLSDHETCRVISVHTNSDKAEERARQAQRQVPDSYVAVLKKTLLGKL